MADYVAALRAKMGDWIYYVTIMKLGKIARECRLAEEIHPNKELDDLIQRAIQDRVQKEMVPYLVKNPQHFYSALVVAVYGGEPEFAPVKVADEHSLIDDNERSNYGFGLLRFDGSQIYYALDGQHRLKSIQEAIKINPDLAKEEITVIVLKHETTREGLERTRRLFSTLNRRAKPTSSGLNIAIDEDDAIAIISRRLMKENKILSVLVQPMLGSKQLNPSKSNDSYITTLAAFYETNEALLSTYNGGLNVGKDFKQFRPTAQELDQYYDYLERVWMLLLKYCPNFEDVLNGSKKAGILRCRSTDKGQGLLDNAGKPMLGGSVFARPIGQFIIADVLKSVGIQGKAIEDAIVAIMSNISMDIEDAPWVNVIWNPNTQRIIGSKPERELVVQLISHSLGLKISIRIRDLKQKYRDSINNPKANLPPPIKWSGYIKSEEEEN